MNTYRHYCITHEPALTARAELAALYRKLRLDSPAMARLLYKRERAAMAKLTELIHSGLHANQSDGLQKLLK
jgi:hypothetical protein